VADDHDSEVPVKLYYRIGEVSQIVGVEPHVLRYWETEFRSIRPQKSRKGQRIYSRRDVDKLLKVKDLLYTHGFTIAGARRRS
jgi:DNA-binding transcriptional MerR regulator